METTILSRLQSCKVVAGFSVHDVSDAVPLVQALLAGGIDTVELTLRTPAALAAVRPPVGQHVTLRWLPQIDNPSHPLPRHDTRHVGFIESKDLLGSCFYPWMLFMIAGTSFAMILAGTPNRGNRSLLDHQGK